MSGKRFNMGNYLSADTLGIETVADGFVGLLDEALRRRQIPLSDTPSCDHLRRVLEETDSERKDEKAAW